MSENKIQNEQELWDVLDGKTPAEPKTEVKAEPKAPKAEAKFAKSGAKGKVDSFFLTCMAGVAAVSVAATLLISGLMGGETPKTNTPPVENNPGVTGEVISGEDASGDVINALELENAELRAQVQLQKDQIKKLQAELLDLSGDPADLPVSTDPNADTELVDAQVEAYEIFNQIKDAYAEFDRETLEQLIPEMDKRLTYLSSSALNEYYTILEYAEMPSNG